MENKEKKKRVMDIMCNEKIKKRKRMENNMEV